MAGSELLARRVAAPVMLLALLVACDRVPLTAPSGSSINMSAGTRVLPTGGSTVITAFVQESGGTPVQNGTTVRFTTTLGRLEPSEVQTRNGVAETTFVAGSESGLAEIRATSGAAGGGGTGTPTPPGNDGGTPPASGSGVVQILVGAAAVEAVTVSASPTTVPAAGGTTTIVASAIDAAGNRLRNVPVTFSTTAGTLSSSNATTDDNGDARVQLTTSREATVTARAADQTATVTVTVAGVSSVGLSVSPSNPVASQPVTLTLTPEIATGNPAPRVVIDWGDNTPLQDIGVVAATRGVTHTYQVAGSYVITATVTSEGETFTTSTGIVVQGLPAVEIDVDVTTGRADITTFTFTITPAIGSTPQNVTINFGDGTTEDLGAITGPTEASKQYSNPGTYSVRATQTNASGTTSTATVVVVVTN